jgi:hypothetical protein
MREERIIKKVNRIKPTTKLLAIATILIISLVMSNISTVKEIKAQPIIPSLQSGKSQQITKTPASNNNQLTQQKSSASICNPNDTLVNATESKICGVPATVKANNTTTTSVSPGPSSILSPSP